MKRRSLFLALMLLPLLVGAKQVALNDIKYELYEDSHLAKITGNVSWSGTNLNIPETITDEGIAYKVTIIGNRAFAGVRMRTVSIPSSVTSIGDAAFSGCINLSSVTIPSSVTHIGTAAFIRCSSLNSITVENGNPVYDSRDNCNAIIETNSNKLLFGCNSTVIPDGITIIGSNAFCGCRLYNSLTIPNSVHTFEGSAFAECSGLTSITIPSTMWGIGDNLFNKCVSLQSVTIPNSITRIGSQAFYGCSSLSSITLPDAVNIIESSAFSGCSKLSSITIPEGVTTIGDDTFSSCSSLSSITLPSTITKIGQAFYGTNLKDVFIMASKVPVADEYTFYECHLENATLHVPACAVKKYQSAAPWSSFGEIVAIEGTEGQEDTEPVKGDMNDDGKITITDAVQLIDIILQGE